MVVIILALTLFAVILLVLLLAKNNDGRVSFEIRVLGARIGLNTQFKQRRNK